MESIPFEERVVIVREILSDGEIECLLKIYRWTKSERNAFFFQVILKRISDYKKHLRGLRQKRFVTAVRPKDPWKITRDGILVGGVIAELRLNDLL